MGCGVLLVPDPWTNPDCSPTFFQDAMASSFWAAMATFFVLFGPAELEKRYAVRLY